MCVALKELHSIGVVHRYILFISYSFKFLKIKIIVLEILNQQILFG